MSMSMNMNALDIFHIFFHVFLSNSNIEKGTVTTKTTEKTRKTKKEKKNEKKGFADNDEKTIE